MKCENDWKFSYYDDRERERKKRRKGDRDRFSPSEMDYTKQSKEKIG